MSGSIVVILFLQLLLVKSFAKRVVLKAWRVTCKKQTIRAGLRASRFSLEFMISSLPIYNPPHENIPRPMTEHVSSYVCVDIPFAPESSWWQHNRVACIMALRETDSDIKNFLEHVLRLFGVSLHYTDHH